MTTWKYTYRTNLVPRALFPGFGPTSKAREKPPGGKVDIVLYCRYSMHYIVYHKDDIS